MYTDFQQGFSPATPQQPARPLTEEETTMAMLAHLLSFFGGGFIGPLVLLIAKRDSPFVKFHALQSLLLCVTWMVAIFVIVFGTMGAFVLGIAAKGGAPPSSGPPLAFFAVFPVIFLGMFG